MYVHTYIKYAVPDHHHHEYYYYYRIFNNKKKHCYILVIRVNVMRSHTHTH